MADNNFTQVVKAAGAGDNFVEVVKIANPEEINDIQPVAALPTPSEDYRNLLLRLTTTNVVYYLNAAGDGWDALESGAASVTSVNGLTGDVVLDADDVVAPRAADIGTFGFVDRAETTIAFNDSTYVFTLASVGANWSYYRSGVRCTITGNKTVTLAGTPPTTDTYYIYIDSTNGTLVASDTGWALSDPADTKVPVAILCFNNTLTPKYCLADERHTCKFPRWVHAYRHLTAGTQVQTAGAIGGISVAPSSPADADNTFSMGETIIWDEDIKHTLTALSDGGTYHIEYRTAADAWAWLEQAIPFKYTTSGYIQWDNAGTMTEAAANKYINLYVCATNANANAKFVIIHGQTEHSSLAAAQAAQFGGLTLTGLQFHELVALYQITMQTSNSYTTTGKCRIAATPVRITTSLTQAPAAPGLGTMSTQNANNVAITGGVVNVPEFEIPEPSADHTGAGLIDPLVTVGEEITAFGTLLYCKSDGKWWKADADAATTMPGLRLSLNTATVAADGTTDTLILGKARDDSWNWTVGGLVYASTTAGELTQAAPSGSGDQVQVVGIAYHADKILFAPSPVLGEIA